MGIERLIEKVDQERLCGLCSKIASGELPFKEGVRQLWEIFARKACNEGHKDGIAKTHDFYSLHVRIFQNQGEKMIHPNELAELEKEFNEKLKEQGHEAPASRKFRPWESSIELAAKALSERAVTHGDYTRNFEIAVDLFRAWTGIALTPIQGNQFMQCLKMAREVCNPECADTRADEIGYIELRHRMEREKDSGQKRDGAHTHPTTPHAPTCNARS